GVVERRPGVQRRPAQLTALPGRVARALGPCLACCDVRRLPAGPRAVIPGTGLGGRAVGPGRAGRVTRRAVTAGTWIRGLTVVGSVGGTAGGMRRAVTVGIRLPAPSRRRAAVHGIADTRPR